MFISFNDTSFLHIDITRCPIFSFSKQTFKYLKEEYEYTINIFINDKNGKGTLEYKLYYENESKREQDFEMLKKLLLSPEEKMSSAATDDVLWMEHIKTPTNAADCKFIGVASEVAVSLLAE